MTRNIKQTKCLTKLITDSSQNAFNFRLVGEYLDGLFPGSLLAREWCRKSHFYYEMWVAAGPLHNFDFAAADGYTESMEFLTFLLDDLPADADATWARIMQFRNTEPRRSIGKVCDFKFM